MAELFSSGRVVDLILAVIVIEALLAAVYFQWHGRGLSPRDMISNLLSGVFLLLALRTSLTGQRWQIAALFLLAAFVAHLVDLARRWR